MSIIIAYQPPLFEDVTLLHVRNKDGSIDILTPGELLDRAAAAAAHEFPLITSPEHERLYAGKCDDGKCDELSQTKGLTDAAPID